MEFTYPKFGWEPIPPSQTQCQIPSTEASHAQKSPIMLYYTSMRVALVELHSCYGMPSFCRKYIAFPSFQFTGRRTTTKWSRGICQGRTTSTSTIFTTAQRTMTVGGRRTQPLSYGMNYVNELSALPVAGVHCVIFSTIVLTKILLFSWHWEILFGRFFSALRKSQRRAIII